MELEQQRDALIAPVSPPSVDPLKNQRSTSFLWPTIGLVVFVGLVANLLPWHEPWFDEAQAWLIARDASLPVLFGHCLRYEGSPGLWHLLLVPLAKGGAPYFSLNVLSALLATVAAAFLFFRSPFAGPLRAALPFTYFFFYQYCIVARNYALLGGVLFYTATRFSRRLSSPMVYAACLAVLSQISLHAMLISGGLYLEWLLASRQADDLRKILWPAVLVVANYLLNIFLLWPAADIYGPVWNFRPSEVLPLALSLFCDSLSPWPILSLAAVVVILLFLYQKGTLRIYLFCALPALALMSVKFANVWHEGILFEILVFSFWLALEAGAPSHARLRLPWLQSVAQIALGALCATQIYWSVAAARLERKLPYTGACAAADYISSHHLDRESLHSFKFSTFALLPYFPHNIFTNYPESPSYWQWTLPNMARQTPLEVMRGNPRYILMGARLKASAAAMTPAIPGYILEKDFRAQLIWKAELRETDSFFLFRRQ